MIRETSHVCVCVGEYSMLFLLIFPRKPKSICEWKRRVRKILFTPRKIKANTESSENKKPQNSYQWSEQEEENFVVNAIWLCEIFTMQPTPSPALSTRVDPSPDFPSHFCTIVFLYGFRIQSTSKGTFFAFKRFHYQERHKKKEKKKYER